MRKVFKYLAVVLALTLLVGTIPVQAASVSLTKTSKVLFIDGCSGKKADGTAAKFYSYMNVQKIVKNFNAKTMDIKLSSEDKSVCTVNNKKDRIYAKGLGVADVTVTVTDTKSGSTLLKKKIAITVKKNATSADLQVSGIENGQSFKVGDTITISLPAEKDTDKRRVVVEPANSAAITKKTSTKFVVEFIEEGEIKVKAESYQSDSYTGATASKSYTVNVKDETVKPEVTPTPTPTPEPTKEPAAGTVAQTALNGVKITFDADVKDVKASDFNVYYMIGSTKIPGPSVKEVKADGKSVALTTYSDFTGNTEYFVDYAGKAYGFKTIEVKAENVTSVDVATSTVPYGKYATLDIRYYIGDIDVTTAVASSLVPMLTQKTGTENAFVVSGNTVYFIAPEKLATFELKVQTGLKPISYNPIYVEKVIALASEAAPKCVGLLYTITTDDGVYMTKDDKVSSTFTVDDTTAVFEALFVYNDGTYKTMAEEGIDSIEIGDQKIFMSAGASLSGGYKLIANNEGTTAILLKKAGQVVNTAAVTVTAARRPASLAVTTSKQSLNVNGAVGDSLIITAKVVDQYGAELKGQTLKITQNDPTKMAFGVAAFGTFNADGTLTVPGSAIVLNSGVKQGTIAATVECGVLKQDITFAVADSSEAKAWIFNSNKAETAIKLETGVKEGINKPDAVVFGVQGIDGNVFVKRENIQFFPSKMPTIQMKASDFGIANGATIYVYTIQKDGKFIDALSAQISATSDEVTVNAFVAGSKLDTGVYTFSAYKVVGGDPVSSVTLLGTRVITVVDNQINPTYSMIKEKTTQTAELAAVQECFKFTLDGKDMPASAIKAVDANKSADGSIFVKTVTVTFFNDVYGYYDAKIEVNKLLSK